MTSEQNYYVTHIIIPEIFENDFDQLFFYSIRDKSLQSKKYYWGKGNNSFNQEQIDDFVDRGLIKKLESEVYPLLLKSNETLWFDSNGIIYKGDLFNPNSFKEKICVLDELKKIK